MDIREYARSQGSEEIRYVKDWNSCKVWRPYFGEGCLALGFPLYFLEKDGECRMATYKENQLIAFGEIIDDDDD